MVRAFAQGAMGRRIDPSWGGPIELFQCGLVVMLKIRRNDGNVLFNDALNTIYLRLYGSRHMVNDHSDSKGTCCVTDQLLSCSQSIAGVIAN